MKRIIISILFILSITSFVKAQTPTDKPRFLKRPTLLCPIDLTKSYSEEGLIKGNPMAFKLVSEKSTVSVDGPTGKVLINKESVDTLLIKGILIDKNYAFDIVQQVGSFSVIKFWNLDAANASSLLKKLKSEAPVSGNYSELKISRDYTTLKVNGLVAISGNESIDLSRSYYAVPTKTILDNSTEFENKSGLWNIGLLVLPIKIRPFATESGQFDFSSGFSVGPTFAWTVHHNWRTNFTHNFLAYVGISSYTADSSKIKETRQDYKIATFSPGIGWMWEKNNVQLSILTGIDFPSGNIQKNWVYRNKPWFGLGLGISLFKINDDEITKAGKN